LWSNSAADEEVEALERLALRTPRIARRELVGELVAVVLLGVAIGLAMLFRLGLATLLMGSLMLMLLAWSAWKRHHLGNRALLIDRQDRATFLRSSVAAKEAELKRSALGLALIVPSTFLTMLLFFTLHDNGAGGDVMAFLRSLFATARGLTATLLLLGAVFLFANSHARLRGELTRLRALQDQYAEEEWREGLTGR
jgi:hypothetical protein